MKDHAAETVPSFRTVFQQIDIEEHSEPGKGPVLRMFGVTEEGHSVLCNVKEFLPYFWVAAPKGFRNEDCKDFVNYLNVCIHVCLALYVLTLVIAPGRRYGCWRWNLCHARHSSQ